MLKPTEGKWEAEHKRSEPTPAMGDPGYWIVQGDVLDGSYGVVVDSLNRDYRISPEEDRANALLCAAAKDLRDGCNALLGLLQIVCGRDDMPYAIKDILETNHRVDEALAAVAKADSSPPAHTSDQTSEVTK